jgi:hypothetical protein
MRRRTGVTATVVLAAAVATTPAFGAAWLSKATARSVAVRMSAETCSAIDWCKGYEVVSPRRCRRASGRAVYCRIVFITAGRDRCGGVVSVSKTRSGRIDRGMAVPMDCSAGVVPV